MAAAHAGLLIQDQADPNFSTFSHRMRHLKDDVTNPIRVSERVGWNLYRYDSLMDLAAYTAAEGLSAEQREQVAGTIIVRSGHDWRARVYSKDGDSYSALADVVFIQAMDPMLQTDNLEPLTERQTAMIRAQEKIAGSVSNPCEGGFHIVTLPAEGGNGWWVYQLRVADLSNRVPEGQHMRYSVSADGSTVDGERSFARRCNMLGRDQAPGEQPQTYNLTHSMDGIPTEVHVYLSLRYGQKLFIATLPSNLYWTVEDGMVGSDM